MITHYPIVLQWQDRTTVKHSFMILCSIIKVYNTKGGEKTKYLQDCHLVQSILARSL